MEEAHQNFISKILEVDEDGERKTPVVGKMFWQYIKSKKRDSGGIATLTSNEKTMEDSKSKAEALNQQFVSDFTNENTQNQPELKGEPSPEKSKLEITEEGIRKILCNVNPKKANGPDNIPNRVLKECATNIAPYITSIFKKSYEEGSVPDDWTMAVITALFKKGDKSLPVNYRPVSLTSVTCKLMEHILFRLIMQHLNKYNILVDYQYGFRQKRSCESQLVTTIEDIAKHLDNKEQVDMLILDFSKAFDVVPHIRLLRKLEHYGINGKILEWIKAWLTQRQQCVAVEGETSGNAQVKSGVPQGTVLGPLMFLLYINDIGNEIKSKLRLFADDSLLYLAIDCKDDCSRLQKDLDKLVEWASEWQMTFNASKCYVLRITNKNKPVIHKYTMHGQILENVAQNPYLGVQLTNTLKWDIHINNIVAKANKSLGFLRRNISKFPEEIKKRASSDSKTKRRICQ